jgi:hypothetical protein
MITCAHAVQAVDMSTGAMRNLLVLRNAAGEELELPVTGGDLQRVMDLLQKEAAAPAAAPGLTDEEIRIIEEHRRAQPLKSSADTEEMADRLMRGEDITEDLYAEPDDDGSALSTPFRG